MQISTFNSRNAVTCENNCEKNRCDQERDTLITNAQQGKMYSAIKYK